MASKILQGELQPRDSLSEFTNSTFKMCSEILDLWIEPLRAFINKSEWFLKDNLLLSHYR